MCFAQNRKDRDPWGLRATTQLDNVLSWYNCSNLLQRYTVRISMDARNTLDIFLVRDAEKKVTKWDDVWYLGGYFEIYYFRFFRNITNFNRTYLWGLEEFDKKKPHFWTFQVELFPMVCRSFKTNNFRESYSSSKMWKFRLKVVNYSWHSGA